MSTYNIPEEPAGPVWDGGGHKWTRQANGAWVQEGETWLCFPWYHLLYLNGPLTDTPPVKKVGDKVTLTEFSKMPDWSIAGDRRDVFINFKESVFTDWRVGEFDLSEFGNVVVTVLRVGDGEL